jgi:hypothetical protein
MSRDALDVLLDEVREPWPTDKAFVDRVMNDVRADEARRANRRSFRRPIVVGLAVAAVVTGGAVAAVVGTYPSPAKHNPAASAPQISSALASPQHTTTGVTVTPKSSAAGGASEPGAVVQKARGYATDHTSFAYDTKTGLKLQTETYTNTFTASRAHQVTLTLTNTGKSPLAFNASKDCALQVMAFPVDAAASSYTNPEDYTGNFEWQCAGTDADPRTQTIPDSFVLAPGASKTLDAHLVIDKPGEWNIVGACRCSYSKVESPSPEKSNPLTDLTRRTLPSPLLPEKSDGANIATPPIRVRAE